MSYDILFVPRRPGQPWQEALDEAEGRDVLTVPVGPERLQQWDRIVEVMRRRTGEVHVVADEDALEATCDSGLQVSLFPDEAALSFPYWEREDPAAFHDLVVDLVGLVEAETGLAAWDAQTDEPFDGRVHDEQGMAATRRLEVAARERSTTDTVTAPDAGGATESGAGTGTGTGTGNGIERTGATVAGASLPDAPAPDPEPAPTPVEPDLADQRRRALRYLVLGAVVVVGSLLLRRGQPEPSLLSGLALAIGVADLVIGAFLYRSWLRRSRAGR